jgi:HEAT repeat protein
MDSEFDCWQSRRNDPRSTEELIKLALSEQDEDAAWEPVKVLHFRGTQEVLEAAKHLCHSDVPKERELGADILGQLGIPNRTFPDESFVLLAEVLSHEQNSDVLQAILIAFSHLRNPQAINLALPWKNHAEADVRYGAVQALSCHEDSKAIAGLIDLANDEDSDVRDWAIFGLGSLINVNTPEIRDALAAHLTDPDEDTRAEAMVGLARRKDSRVIAPLIEELSAESVVGLAVEAAKEIGHPDLVSALTELKEWWPGDSIRDAKLLEEAILSCRPKS